ncbi:MAG: LPS export ABC transporter periplasmic protein LptC [Deltaproteobacteria bacterium]|nr:LPS export ABC transporter periplasmic protein LptC [Deltaproteobacteria bacterium]MBW1986396.1 LPS export ABC transporter periplasmic protein LptC [Deltaproteobacteria bacterium]MBW2133791.1 LPS export ABC transporter periplasmic protein LptC [Deltaproteobacteria bacterium]
MDKNKWLARKGIRRAILLIMVGGLALGWWTLIRPQPGEKTVTSPTSALKQPSHMEAIRLTEIEEGDKKWTLVAKQADYLKDQNLIRLTDVRVEVFWKEGGNITLIGNIGYINTKTRQLTLEGEVQVRLADYRFTAPEVSYIPKKRVLLATGAVDIEGPQIEVKGRDLRVELDNKKLVLTEHLLTRCRFPEKIGRR